MTPPNVSRAGTGSAFRTDVLHPDAQQLLDTIQSIGPLVRDHGDEAERARRLPRPVLDALAGAGLQRLFAPRAFGGLEVDPWTCARIVEEVAHFDSAAGWALQSGNVNAWWASRLPDDGAEEIYGRDPSAPMAAAFHPPQQAFPVQGGFRVSGRAPLASMIHDSEWILFSAFVMEDGRPKMTGAGPDIRAVILPVSDVEIIDTWDTLGMRGTDSNDAAFDDVFVPARRTFPFAPDAQRGRHYQGPLYRFPGATVIALFSAPVLLATARNALAEFRQLAGRKTPFGSMKTLRDRETVQSALADAEATLRSARAFFYDSIADAWSRTLAGEPHTLEQKADLLLSAIHASQGSARVTDVIQRLAGTTGIYTKSRLDRYFRDAHTLRHHGLVSENKLQAIGQIYLGLAPDFPLIAF